MYEARDEATDIIIEQTNNIITNNKYIVDDTELNNLFLDYLTMRKKIKKPASEKAI